MQTHTTTTQARVGGRGALRIGPRSVVALGFTALACAGLAAPASAGAHEYKTTLTITREGAAIGHCREGAKGCVFWHGEVNSEVRKCEDGRRVVLFKQQRGADRKLGTALSEKSGGWGLNAPTNGRVYAKVKPGEGDGYVCRADRSRTLRNGAPINPPHGL